MNPEIIKFILIGGLIVSVVIYFSTKPNFEMLLLVMAVAGAIYVIKKKETYSAEGV